MPGSSPFAFDTVNLPRGRERYVGALKCPDHGSSIRIVATEIAWIFFFYAGWFTMFLPAVFHLDSGFLGGVRSDPAAYIYYVIHNMQHVLSWPSVGFDAQYFYPFGKSLAYSDNFILPALVAKLVYSVTGTYTVAYNLTLISASVLNGYLTFCLSRYLTRAVTPSLIAGFVFMCLPFLYGHPGHPQLQFAFAIPGVVLASLRFAEKRSFLAATAIGGLIVLQFLCTAYYALIGYLLAALTLGCYGILRFRTLRARDVLVLFAANIPWAICLWLLSAPYKAVREAFGPMHPSLVKHFSASFSSYASMSPKHYVWGFLAKSYAPTGGFLSVGIVVTGIALATAACLLLYPSGSSGPGERSSRTGRLFIAVAVAAVSFLLVWHLGFAASLERSMTLRAYVISAGLWTLLAVVGVALLSNGRRAETGFRMLSLRESGLVIVFLGLFFFFASFGIIGGHGTESPNPGLYMQLYRFLPGYNSMRAVYRFGVVVGLMMAVLSAVGLTWLFRRSAFRSVTVRCCVLLPVFALIVLELKTGPYSPTHIPGRRPRVYDQLAKQPDSRAVISLPFRSPLENGLGYARLHTGYMLWMARESRPFMSGWSSKVPRFYQFAGVSIDTFPSQASLNTLGQIVGLEYLVYHGKLFDGFDPQKFKEQLAAAGEQVELLYETPRRPDFLFRLRPEVDLLQVEYPALYLRPETTASRRLTFEMRMLAEGKGKQGAQAELSIQTGYRNARRADGEVIEMRAIPADGRWHTVVLELPPSHHAVIPQQVQFLNIKELNLAEAEVRGMVVLENTD